MMGRVKHVLCTILCTLLCFSGDAWAQEHVQNGNVNVWVNANPPAAPCNTNRFPNQQSLGIGLPAGQVANPTGWSNGLNTPDLYLACDGTIPVQEVGYLGNFDLQDLWYDADPSYAGFIGLWVQNGYREWVMNELSHPLIPGVTYTIRMRVAVKMYSWADPIGKSLYTPKTIRLRLLSTLQMYQGRLERVADNITQAEFEIIDANGHGNVFDPNGGYVNGDNRWQEVSLSFTVPMTMVGKVTHIAISPGGNELDDDLIALNRNPRHPQQNRNNTSYIYIDGVSIQKQCSCEQVTVTIRPVPSANPDECCFVVDVAKPHWLPLKNIRVWLDNLGESTNVFFKTFTQDERESATFSTGVICAPRRADGKPLVVVADVRLDCGQSEDAIVPNAASGMLCRSRAEILCACDCGDIVPKIRFEKSENRPNNDDEDPEAVCCYDAYVDVPMVCSGVKISTLRIERDYELVAEIDEPISLDEGPTSMFIGRFCNWREEYNTVHIQYTVSVNGQECPPVNLDKVLNCDECCLGYSVGAVSLNWQQLMFMPFPTSCQCGPPIAIQLINQSGMLCSDAFTIIDPDGLTKTVTVSRSAPTAILDFVCRGAQPRRIIIRNPDHPDCDTYVDIPACTDNPDGGSDDGDVGPGDWILGKASPRIGSSESSGASTVYTLTITDIRGIVYASEKGAAVESLLQHAEQQSYPRGLYMVYVHDMFGRIVARRMIVH